MRIAITCLVDRPSDVVGALERARAVGAAGVELRLPSGAPSASSAADAFAAAASDAAASTGVSLCSVDAGLTLPSDLRAAAALARGGLPQLIAFTRAVGAEAAIVRGAPVHGGASRDRALTAAVTALNGVGSTDGRIRVVIRGGGALRSSDALWYVCDAAGADRVGVSYATRCSGPQGESPSVWLKRMAALLHSVEFSAATWAGSDERDARAECVRVIELLKGVAFRGWLVLREADADPASLESATRELMAELNRPVVELSAYKGDKNAPRFPSRRAAG